MGTQTILSEDFENGIPSTCSNTTLKTQKWDTQPLWNTEFDEPLKYISGQFVHVDLLRNAELYGVTIDLEAPDPQINPNGITDGRWILMLAGQNYAMWQEGPNTPAAGTPSEAANLDTPTLNLSSASAVYLDFDSEMLVGNGASSRYDAYVSVDGGQNFERIYTNTGALMDYEEGSYFDHHYLEVPQAAGKSAVVFRFHAEGQDPPIDDDPLNGTNGTMGGFWAIDKVRVTANVGAGVDQWSAY